MSTRVASRQASPPTEARLREAALWHLARYATTKARLSAALQRRIDSYARQARDAGEDADLVAERVAAARLAADRIVTGLAAAKLVDDAAFAASRARRLRLAGRSAAQVARHLTERGIAPSDARAAAARDDNAELAAALMLLRRRRLGPFGPAADRARMLAVLARAGFGRTIAEAALATGRDEAEQRIADHRREQD